MAEFVQHIFNGLSLGSIYALIALGYTLVYGILQLINFAHADVYMVGAFFAYYMGRALEAHSVTGLGAFVLLLAASMGGCAMLGIAIERFAYRPLRKAPKLNILITAIGVSLLLQNGAQALFGADPKSFPMVLEDIELWSFSGLQIRSLDISVFGTTILALLGLRYFIYFTKTGRALRAMSSNMNVAALLGVNTNKLITIAFALGSALAGVASVLVGMKYPKIDPLMGVLIGMKAFVAAVLGGIGNLWGAVLGGLIMGLSEEMVVGYVSSTYRDALAFGLLIVILIVKPTGLFGRNQVEKV